MNKRIKTLIYILCGISCVCLLCLPFSSEAKYSFSAKPILSVLGDSISSYYGYEYLVYYGPSGTNSTYTMSESNTWWRKCVNQNGYSMGYNGAMGFAQASLDGSYGHSMSNPDRIERLQNNGVPNTIAVYGGVCDLIIGKVSVSDFYYGYNKLINKLHNYYTDTKLILIAPGYFLPEYKSGAGMNGTVDSYNNSIKKIANTYNDYYVDLRGALNSTSYFDSSYIHPKELGMSRIAEIVKTALSNQRGATGIEGISANLDYDHYVIKVNAYNTNYDNLRFKFRLTNDSTGEVIYNEDWSKNNCFVLDTVNPNVTYTAYAEIDNNGDGICEATDTKQFRNLYTHKRTGGTVYNGVDYSKVYDFNYYVENNPDLYNVFKNNPQGALEHFVNNGMNEGRQAKSTFSVISYRNRWSDLRRAFGWNNLAAYYKHYMDCGYKEGRQATGCNTLQNPINSFFGYDCSAIYDFNYYIDNNPDVKNALNADEEQVFLHFISCGMREGRRSCANFDVYSYRNQYADLRQIFGWNNLVSYYAHYNDCGRREGRAGTGCTTVQNPLHSFWGVDFSPVYNYQYYIEHNPDVYRALNGDDAAIFGHFLASGVNEGRRASERFDVVSYRNQWSDLRQVFGWNNLAQYYFHYVNAGAREGRPATGCSKVLNPTHTFLGIDISDVYDYQYYIEHNPDVKNAFGGDDTSVMIHFVAAGIVEGRQASQNFNVWKYANNNPDLVSAFGFDLAKYYEHYIKSGKREGRVAV